MRDPTVIISIIAILISIVALVVSIVIYNMESKAKFREAHFNLITKATPNYFKALDLFIKLENIFRDEKFLDSWNSGNLKLKDHLSKTLSLITETSIAVFPAAGELMEIVTFNFKRVKVVCFEPNESGFPDVKGMRKVGNELYKMAGDLAFSNFLFTQLLSIEQNHSALSMLFDGDKDGYEREIKNRPGRKKEFFLKNSKVFEDIKSFNELYDSNNQTIRSDLNKNFIREVSNIPVKARESHSANG